MTDRLTCAMVDEHDLVAGFVAGRLSEADAEALEVHCLTCERCWTELRLATRVHAAAAHGAGRSPMGDEPRRHARFSRASVALALAASILIAAVGMYLVSRSGDEDDIQRGAGDELLVTATKTSRGELRLDWADVDGAARYLVEVYRDDGSLVSSREIAPSEIVIELQSGPPTNGSLTVSVTAFDALGTRLGQSPVVSVP